ncbi:MAG: hypothetical protein VW455_12980 [Nitrospinota bacterium]
MNIWELNGVEIKGVGGEFEDLTKILIQHLYHLNKNSLHLTHENIGKHWLLPEFCLMTQNSYF